MFVTQNTTSTYSIVPVLIFFKEKLQYCVKSMMHAGHAATDEDCVHVIR